MTTVRSFSGRSSMALSLCAVVTVFAAPAVAQDSPAHAHMGHVADGFGNTPDGAGLLPTAIAEAEVARQHAELALRDTEDLGAMQRHAGHVLHALDPSRIQGGPGAGYGVVEGASGVVRHIEMAGEHESASENIKTHATHVATAAGSVVARAEEGATLAERIVNAGSAAQAAELLEELATLTERVLHGYDADGDGRIGWQEGEGGLAQAEQHMTLMKRGEGMSGG
ncbi:MAG: hypothetical protein U5R14_03100 [Gemmatimonadota bacterium]|nr:hypothetical protein [Gemmatimonadota bacterium]